MPLLSRIEFAAIAQYSVRGTESEIAQNSRNVRGAVKRGDLRAYERGTHHILDHPDAAAIRAMFGPDVVVVPAPGSAPIRKRGLWVPQLICEALVRAELAADCRLLLTRTRAVPKSAFASQGERPNAQTHYETMRATHSLEVPARIVVIDDVVTRGCTLLAAVSRLAEAYPQSDIKAFALLRAVSSDPIGSIAAPRVGQITLLTDNTTRRTP